MKLVICERAKLGKCNQHCTAAEPHLPETMSKVKDCTWSHLCKRGKITCLVKCIPIKEAKP